MPKIRLAVISTPRTGNTWPTMMLARFYHVPRVALHELTEEAWRELPEEVVLQIHWRWDAGLTERLQSEGFRIITLTRHPFDILISILHVVVYDVASERWLLGAKGDERQIWAATPRSRNFVAYCKGPRAYELLSVTCDYWHRPEVLSVRYEDLVADPRAVLGTVEGHFGPRRVANVEEMLQFLSIGNLRKTATTNHFWKGQAGLWRQFLPPHEAAEIAEPLGPIFRTLGYAIDPDPSTDAESAHAAWNQAAGEDMGTTIRRLRAESQGLRLRVEELEAHAQAVAAVVSERDDRVRDLAHDVTERDEQLRRYAEGLRTRDERLRGLVDEVRSRDEQLREMQQQLRRRDEQLRELADEVRRRDEQLLGLSAEVHRRDEHVRALAAHVSELEAQPRSRIEQVRVGFATELRDYPFAPYLVGRGRVAPGSPPGRDPPSLPGSA